MRKFLLLFPFIIGCMHSEPRIVNAYRIYNNSNDTIEVVEFIIKKEITDSDIFNYSRPYKVFNNGAKFKNEKVFISPKRNITVQLTSNWKEICKKDNIGVLVLNKDTIRSIQFYKEGLVKISVLQFIQLNLDSLRKSNYEIFYYGTK